MHILEILNYSIAVLFTLCYSYQFLYIPISLLKRSGNRSTEQNDTLHSFGVLICARNEETVICDLIKSIQSQDYPTDKLHVFVLADNCTDQTAFVSKRQGVTVYERFNQDHVGKGYALEFLIEKINQDYPDGFDGYCVLDADNLLDKHFFCEMNKTFSEGYDMVTSYRNSKNYGDNWISSGYALWFLRESRYLNEPRHLIGSSCAVSGTGFIFSRKIAEEIKTWPYHLLTEDIEFSVDQIIKGRRIGYCRTAELYDEQPVRFSQSWNQRMRWSRGFLQVFHRYGRDLIKGMLKGDFSCFDMTMAIMPAFVLSTLSIVCNIVLGIWGAVVGEDVSIALLSIAQTLVNTYALLFVLGGITTVTEWDHILASPIQKIVYTFTFPLFMFTYLPISIVSLFSRPEWKPIEHSVTEEQIRKKKKAERN